MVIWWRKWDQGEEEEQFLFSTAETISGGHRYSVINSKLLFSSAGRHLIKICRAERNLHYDWLEKRTFRYIEASHWLV